MTKKMRETFEENFYEWTDQIKNILKEIPDNSMRLLLDLTKEMKNDPSPDAIHSPDTPIVKQWELIYFSGPAAHMWQLIRLPNGNHTWDTMGDISDITVQVYANGWIFIVCNALDIKATYSPTAVKRIREYTDKLHDQDKKFREKYNRLIEKAADSQDLLEPVYVNICKNTMKTAKLLNSEPADELDLQAARQNKNNWEVFDELDRVFPNDISSGE